MYTIYRLGNQETLKYAARELASYLTLVTGEDIFKIVEKENYNKALEGIWLGVADDMEITFEVEDKQLDDGIAIEITRGNGVIVGINERSILIGVYRFLTELGCRWVRPCKDGEILVHRTKEEMNVSIKEVASLRHRGIVIEGANTYQNVVDIIEWMPKLGYNSYFIQFMHAHTFFKQWYAHTENSLKAKEFFDDEMAIDFTAQITRELKKRGMIYHAVGHGWTSESIGVVGRGWDAEEQSITQEQRECLALIDGKRDFFRNIPLNTNLCYSSTKVQEKFTDSIVKYAKENRQTDMIHVWVADEYNNHCECEMCSKLTPTDWYVQILNKLDEKLTAEGLDNKIVFLLYFELLWTPIKERINHPERFLMMFAPISRTFTKSFEDSEKTAEEIKQYEINKVKLPTSVTSYLKFLEGWQDLFKGDSFDFDYHLGRAHYGDAGYYEIAKIISRDIKHLESLGLNGLLSCQQQRTFFPTALPSYVMGKTLWDTSLDFEEIAQDYFTHAFGQDSDKCKEYLTSLSEIFDMDYWHLARGAEDKAFSEKVLKAHQIVEQFEEIALANQNHKSDTEKLSWQYIAYHLEYTKLFANALSAKAAGQEELANKYWTEFANYICENEDELQRVLDVFRILMIGRIFGKFTRCY
ncbi:MAG: DUF4838 domain-containing protein [Cellulosilyticaceae bacterium]